MTKQTITLETQSREETQSIARILGTLLDKGTIITLEGDLGAGKTTFTQGLARGLDISEKVNSPTFVIMKEYQGRLPLIHIDAYRLEGIHQDLGFEDYFDENYVVVIEWSDFLDYLKDYDTQHIKLETIKDNQRRMTLTMDNHLIEKLENAL